MKKQQTSNPLSIPPSGVRGIGVRGIGIAIRRKRYYLHRRVKKFTGVTVFAKEKTLHTPFTQLADMPVGLSFYVKQLIVLGYNIQTQLFN